MGTLLHWKRVVKGAGGLFNPQYPGDAGFDMAINIDFSLPPMSKGGLDTQPKQIPCGFAMAIPEGMVGLVMARSSAVKRGVLVPTTVIDSGYRGPMFIMAYNTTRRTIELKAGERIAQLLVVGFAAGLRVNELTELDLPSTERGEKGFGSSGK
jgi:dUTP pyrophosphatase